MLSDETKFYLKRATEDCLHISAKPKTIVDEILKHPRRHESERTSRVIGNIAENPTEAEQYIGCLLGYNG